MWPIVHMVKIEVSVHIHEMSVPISKVSGLLPKVPFWFEIVREYIFHLLTPIPENDMIQENR